ncbi:MAG TPA: 2OG-Fe(II) oxygenase family protein [Candidatus Paceibacterota bacterium]|nr:2OG-Fe(II) oxygenase family protein [Candidatus Paceibacterota bacterium]
MNLAELKREGRLYVKYPEELRAGVEEAVEAWRRFCALSREQKLKFPYAGDTNVSGNGYELKEGEAIDLKENFHLRASGKDELARKAERVDDFITPAFVKKATALPALMAPLLQEFGRQVEEELGVEGFEEDLMSMQENWLVRFLHYFPARSAGEEIAAPHNDKGGFTLHLYESHPGVERLTFDTKEWVPMDLDPGETVIFAGNGLQHRSKNQLRALSHRVLATPETATEGRYSAVCFFSFKNAKYFDKSRFGSQQLYPPGSFYDMPFEKFDEFFIS